MRNKFNVRSSIFPKIRIIYSNFKPLILVLVILWGSNLLISGSLHSDYDKPEWAQSHPVWYAAVIGVTTDPVLYKKYVCTQEPLEDRLNGFRPLLCEETTKSFTRPRLYYGVFQQPSDMHGYHAAVKYLREHGSHEQLGTENINSVYINMNWNRFDEIMRDVYFDMIRESPLDLLYMHIIVKPLKYIKEVAMYAIYFSKSIIKSEYPGLIVSLLLFMIAIYFRLLLGYRKLDIQKKELSEETQYIIPIYLMIIFSSSLMLSILFYSQSHTIHDSIILLMTLSIYSSVIFLKKLFN